MTRTQIVAALADGVNLSNGDFSQQDYEGLDFEGGQFAKCDFTNTDLSRVCLIKANFSEAVLRSANLEGADVDRADFTGADLTGAYLGDCNVETAIFKDTIGIRDAGKDSRGYRFIGVLQDSGSWRIKAGCRWYTVSDALEHWDDVGNQDALARVREIAGLSDDDNA